MRRCVFCDKDRFWYHKQAGIPFDNAIVYQNDSVYVTPDISPICKGHFLIIPFEHCNGFLYADRVIINSVKDAVGYICQSIYKHYEFTCFEHGMSENSEGASSVDHAHLHIFPVALDIDLMDSTKCIQTYKPEEEIIQVMAPYIMTCISGVSPKFYTIDKALPSQFLRFLYGDALGVTFNCDWKNNYTTQESKRRYFETLSMCERK